MVFIWLRSISSITNQFHHPDPSPELRHTCSMACICRFFYPRFFYTFKYDPPQLKVLIGANVLLVDLGSGLARLGCLGRLVLLLLGLHSFSFLLAVHNDHRPAIRSQRWYTLERKKADLIQHLGI